MNKKTIHSILSLLLALVMVLGVSVPAYAKSGVTFQDGKVIAFEPGSTYAGSDLFGNFKGVMPGDVRTEEVTILNNTKDCDYIKAYLRAIPHDGSGNPVSEKVLAALQADSRREATTPEEYMYNFLSMLHMKVRNGETVIYEDTPDKQGGLAQNVYLGTVRKGESLTLNVELGVPIELDNKYMSRIGEVDWVFVAEAFDDPTPTPTVEPEFPDGYAYTKKVTITKKLFNSNGKAKKSKKTFYAGVFSDSSYTTLSEDVDNPIIPLDLNGSSSAEVTVDVSAPTEDTNIHLYITEVDAKGVPVSQDADFAYDVEVENGNLTLTMDSKNPTVVIKNTVIAEDDAEATATPVPTTTGTSGGGSTATNHSTSTTAPKTGDDTPIAFYVLLLMAAAAVIFTGVTRRRGNR